MPVFNPYVKQKKATSGVSAPSNPPSSKANNTTKPPIVAATPGAAVVTALKEPPLQPMNSTVPPSAPNVSLGPPSSHKTPKATVPRAITPFTISAKKGPVSFKAQLKQQIKELKLKKQIAQLLKAQQLRQKELEAEQKRKEEEAQRVKQKLQEEQERRAKELEKEREEELKRLLLFEEQRRKEREAILAKEAKIQQEKERLFLEDQQRLITSQQIQDFGNGSAPQAPEDFEQKMIAYNGTAPFLVAHAYPGCNMQSVPGLFGPASYYTHNHQHYGLQQSITPSLSPFQHYQHTYPLAPHNSNAFSAFPGPVTPVSTTTRGLMKSDLIPSPAYNASMPTHSPNANPVSASLSDTHVLYPLMTSSALFAQHWAMRLPQNPVAPIRPTPRPRVTRERPPKKEVIYHNPLESPSPYADDYEILTHPIVIIKEEGGSFGVSLLMGKRDVLLDKDDWDALVVPKEAKEERRDTVTSVGSSKDFPANKVDTVAPVFEKESSTRTIATHAEPPDRTLSPVGENKATTVEFEEGPRNQQQGGINFPSERDNPILSEHVPALSNSDCNAENENMTSADKPIVENTASAAKKDSVPDQVMPTDAVTAKQTSPDMSLPKPKQEKRKRFSFHVLLVTDVSKQNQRNPEADPEKKLKMHDIILEINGSKTAGLTLQQACELFASHQGLKNEKGEDPLGEKPDLRLVECSLTIARKKSKADPTKESNKEAANHHMLPINRVSTETGEFSAHEMTALAVGFAKTLVNPTRTLGFEGHHGFDKGIGLAARDQLTIQAKLSNIIGLVNERVTTAANAHWKKYWEGNFIDIEVPGTSSNKFMTLAQISAIRSLPRPLRGCRCGSSDHDYVNNPRCVLYHHLRKLSGDAQSESHLSSLRRNIGKHEDLRALQNAFKERYVKLKEDLANEETEAKFVAKMENVQTSQLKKAIFAPSLTVMVLCAIAEVASDFQAPEQLWAVPSAGTEIDIPEPVQALEEHDDDDDDDLPLLSLGKRPAEDLKQSDQKRMRRDDYRLSLKFNPGFLAKLLLFISETWGHVYHEPSHSDYTWRWEVHHGQTSETSLSREKLMNPRKPGSLTFEGLQFAFDEDTIQHLAKGPIGEYAKGDPKGTSTIQWAQDFIAIAHLVSLRRTGLLDELQALEKVGIIEKSNSGIAFLAKDWYTRVDPLILEDLDARWSLEKDPDNKYLIHSKVKRDLANYWIRVDGAWALNEDLSELVFIDDEWDEWRRSWEDEIEKKADKEDGIGKFGI